MFDHDKFFYFAQITPTSGSVGFRNYTDNEGNTYSAFATLGVTFNDHKPFWVNFSARERIYRAAKDREILVSKNGDVPKKMKLVDFLKNSPFTEGSPNLRGNATIKLMDEVKDAKIAVDRAKLRLDAGNLALGLSPDETTKMAQLIGYFGDDPMVQKRRVLEFSDQEPELFTQLYHGEDRDARSLVKKGLASKVLKLRGKMVVWDKMTLGPDEDSAIARLMKEPELRDAVAQAVKKMK